MSRARNVGLSGLVLAVAVHVAITMPAQQDMESAAAREEQIRRERSDVGRRLAVLEKKAALLDRAQGLMTGAGASSDSLERVRSNVVRLLRDAQLRKVRLEVRPGSAPVVAGVSVSAEAGFFDAVQLLAKLARPSSGLVLQRVGFSDSPISVTVEAAALGAPS